jgi:hypothetical protein
MSLDDWHLAPEDQPDHLTWIADMLKELQEDGLAIVEVHASNPIELARRERFLNQQIEIQNLPLIAEIDGDVLVVTLDT